MWLYMYAYYAGVLNNLTSSIFTVYHNYTLRTNDKVSRGGGQTKLCSDQVFDSNLLILVSDKHLDVKMSQLYFTILII